MRPLEGHRGGRRDGIVTIRLREPDPDFLYKLALTLASSCRPARPPKARAPVPGTGPYRIAEHSPERRVRLVRNRHFKEWSKAAQPEGIPDEIVVASGAPPTHS